jgi:hypothetical protein
MSENSVAYFNRDGNNIEYKYATEFPDKLPTSKQDTNPNTGILTEEKVLSEIGDL